MPNRRHSLQQFAGLFVILLILTGQAAGQPQGIRLPDSIQLTQDLPYAATENPRQTLDLLMPRRRIEGHRPPLIVYIHGGAWRAGNKRDGYRQLAGYITEGRFAGASVAYRLSQEARWPAQIHDCMAAIRWLRAHAQKYGYDPDRIAVMGHSAGGHLVATLGVGHGIASLQGTLGDHLEVSSKVQCVVNFFGPSELLRMDDYPSQIVHNSADSPESRLVGGPLQEMKDVARHASPTTHVTQGDAPMLLVHGSRDPLVPFNQSQRLADRLKQANVQVILIKMENGGHGGFGSRELDSRVLGFLARQLLGEKAHIPDTPIVVRPRK